MPNTYTQIHLQLVFAVKHRAALIASDWENLLYRYITGIVSNLGHKVLVINGMPDHIHLLVGYRPQQALADLMRVVKGDSSEWINKNKLTKGVFRWQEGYGAFSYHKKLLPVVCDYIENQKQHHQRIGFAEEYKEMLKEFQVDFNPNYLFTEPV